MIVRNVHLCRMGGLNPDETGEVSDDDLARWPWAFREVPPEAPAKPGKRKAPPAPEPEE